MLLGQEKDPRKPQRLVGERVRGERFQLAVFQDEAVDFLAMGGAKGKEGPFGPFFSAAAEPVAEGVAKIEQERRALVVIPHEGLHPAKDGPVLVAETVGDLSLQPQGEHIAGPLLQVMEFSADAQQEVVGAVELLAFGRRQQLRVDKGLGAVQPALHFPDPDQVLIIAQAAATVLDVGFLEKRRVAGLFVPVALVGHAPGQVLLFMAVQAAALESLPKFREDRFVSAEKAGFQQRGLGAQVAVGLGDEFLHGARGVSDLKTDVPEHVENVLDDVVHLARVLRSVVGIEKKNVDVAVGIEFAPAESPHGQQGDARRGVHMRAQMGFPRAVPKMAQHDGDNVGALVAKFASAFAVDVFELEPVVLQFQKAAVNIEQIGRPQMGLVDQFPFGVAQNLFKIDRRHQLKLIARARQFNG